METMGSTGRQVIWGKRVEREGGERETEGTKESLASFCKTRIMSKDTDTESHGPDVSSWLAAILQTSITQCKISFRVSFI